MRKVEKPQVWDSKKDKWVDASKGKCSRCGKKDYIAIAGPGGKYCFPCYEEREKRWM